MSEKDKLNLWIVENVMGWMKSTIGHIECSGRYAIQGNEIYIHDRGNYIKLFQPTTDPAAAMMVLEKCLTVANVADPSFCSLDGKHFWVRTVRHNQHIDGEAETLPLAICKFAQKLFSK